VATAEKCEIPYVIYGLGYNFFQFSEVNKNKWTKSDALLAPQVYSRQILVLVSAVTLFAWQNLSKMQIYMVSHSCAQVPLKKYDYVTKSKALWGGGHSYYRKLLKISCERVFIYTNSWPDFQKKS